MLADADTADMLERVAATYRRPDIAGVAVVDGWGARVRVERGHLECADGLGEARRVRSYPRVGHGLCRVVVLATTGTVSLEALRWCEAVGLPLVVATDEGCQLATTPGGMDDARLRRAQAAAGLSDDHPCGVAVVVELLSAKLAGHGALARERFARADAAATIADLAAALREVETITEARQLEASAAAAYWSCWSGHPAAAARFARRDAARVPAHWLRYDSRRSGIGAMNGNRRADRPVNALLNYAYRLAEVEARSAAVRVGLDPGLGLLHLDERGRDSLALDLLEPVRPVVEAFTLDLLEQRTFTRSDFHEMPDGVVRVTAPLTHDLASALPRFAEALAPHAEATAHRFAELVKTAYRATTPLTHKRSRDAAARVRARRAAASSARLRMAAERSTTDQPALQLYRCPDCGGAVEDSRHVRCRACIAADPRQAPDVRSRRGRAIAARKASQAAWEAAGGSGQVSPDSWEEIREGLASIPLARIMAAAGISKGFASQVRAGQYRPHVSTWPALAALAGVSGGATVHTEEAHA